MSPTVSIIMPVYRAEPYLEEALDSLRRQSFGDFEVILVDDGSSDGSVRIQKAFVKRDPRGRVIRQAHQFAGAARNNGMRQATGKYLLFLDADDLFMPQMLERCVARAEETRADIVVFPVNQYHQRTGRLSDMPWTCDRSFCPKDSETFSRKTNRGHLYCFTNSAPWNKLFRRDFIERNHILFQHTQTANDVAFVMTALAVAERIAVLDEVLMTYRSDNPTSL